MIFCINTFRNNSCIWGSQEQRSDYLPLSGHFESMLISIHHFLIYTLNLSLMFVWKEKCVRTTVHTLGENTYACWHWILHIKQCLLNNWYIFASRQYALFRWWLQWCQINLGQKTCNTQRKHSTIIYFFLMSKENINIKLTFHMVDKLTNCSKQ